MIRRRFVGRGDQGQRIRDAGDVPDIVKPEAFRHIKFLTKARRAVPRLAISALVCSLPLLLLYDLRSVFDFDWFNHLWMIEYFGEYLRRHGTPPAVFATENL